MDLVVVFALFVFMLTLLFSFDATVFSVNKDLYILYMKMKSFIHRQMIAGDAQKKMVK